jgi:hypothetical protein
MALPVNRPLNVTRVYANMADSSSAGSAFTVSPVRGTVILLGSVVHGAVGTANNVLTAKIATTAITIPTWIQATASSAAGDVSEVTPTAANTISAGQNIEFISDGAGSNTVPTTFYADIRAG